MTATRVTRGRDLFEQLQPFTADAEFVCGESGGVASRPRQTCDEAAADRIDGRHEYDRHGATRLLQRPDDGPGRGQNDVWRECDQFLRVSAKEVGIEPPSPGQALSARD
jgi:hypothetical protein